MKYIQTHRITAIFLGLLLITAVSLGASSLFAQSTNNTTIVAFGDSLVVGTGATTGNDFVSVLSRNINRPIARMGVSGDTTISAMARVNNVTALHPAVVILFLGGNDILQGIPQSSTISNLLSIIISLEQSGAQVILVGIDNPNIPSSYATAYANLAAQTGVDYIPGVLVNIVGNSQLTIDGVHPNDQGHLIIAQRIQPTLQAKVNALPTGSTGTNGTLSVTCIPSVTSGLIGNSITWTANATGGTNGNYTYSWNGSNNLVGSTQTITTTYPNEGRQNASVTVTSNGVSATAQCTPVDIQQPKITGFCSVSASINSGTPGNYTVQWNSNITNEIATTTTYAWSGTDGLGGVSPSISKTYTTPGLKQGVVTIQSGTQSFGLTCSADIHAVQTNPTESLSASCDPSVNGMNVQWNTSASGTSNIPLTYIWTGTDGISTTSPNFNYTYTTEGTKNVTVLVTSGSQSMTLQCQARVASTTPASGHCFIATAAYGTPLEKEVQVLRNFRDETLMQSNNGKLFVKAYYAVSPPIAEFIRDNETLKAVVRGGLEPIVKGLEVVGYEK